MTYPQEMTYAQKQAGLAKMADSELQAVIGIASAPCLRSADDQRHWAELKDIAQWLLIWRTRGAVA